MSDEDPSVPIVLSGPGWEKSPDGIWQLPVECPTPVHYVTLPKTLQIGPQKVYKSGWDSDRRYAYYREVPKELSKGSPSASSQGSPAPE
jgi:hypothetical protein